ncbi:TPA: type III-B CRISPR module RAMP protein Cmr4, partial [Candidatus Poribacteria bacterium]|nr:type III-B CRISPR module RAMP protein Cmr4 [Candidatus Poribacteria bacterium]
EPATDLPKIPGTGLHGPIRHYAARYAVEKLGDRKYLDCAGQVRPNQDHDKKCPICSTFGRPGEEEVGAGMANVHDAQILFFAVSSMYGAVWVTTPRVLSDYGILVKKADTEEEITEQIPLGTAYRLETATGIGTDMINLGWLVFHAPQNCRLESHLWPLNLEEELIERLLKSRLLVVDEGSFTQIVRSNLEVRTSVSIDPKTGAAKGEALFTYEAIPRGTILAFEVIWDKYREFESDFEGRENVPEWNCPEKVFETGLTLIETLGVGGIGTRGFGRMKWLKRREN